MAHRFPLFGQGHLRCLNPSTITTILTWLMKSKSMPTAPLGAALVQEDHTGVAMSFVRIHDSSSGQSFFVLGGQHSVQARKGLAAELVAVGKP